MAKTKTDFITIRLINQVYDGSEYKFRLGDKLAIRLDTITEVKAPASEVVYLNKPGEGFWKAKSETMKIAYILKSTGNGKGINGVSYGYYVDEDSYTRLTKALGIEL